MATRAIEEADNKRRRIETNGNNIIHGPFDHLPDEVIAKILSFVPFPDLVLTMRISLGNRRISRLCRDHEVCGLLYLKKEWDPQMARRIINLVGPRMKRLDMKGDNANSDLAILALERSPLLESMVCDERVLLSSSMMKVMGKSNFLRKFWVTTLATENTSPYRPSANTFISNVPNLKNLTLLHFYTHVYFDDLGADLVTHIADHCKRLEDVKFPYLNSLTDAVLDYFLDKVKKTLIHITFFGHLLNIGSTSNLKSCHFLKDLRFQWAQQLENAGLLTIVKELPKTTTRLLIAHAPRITGEGFVEAFTGSRSVARFTILNLDGCSGLDDLGLDAITKSCPNLTLLNLSRCSQISDKGVSSVLRRCQKLTEFWLISISVSEKAFVGSGGKSNHLKTLVVNSDLVVEISRIMPFCHVINEFIKRYMRVH